MWIKLFFFSYRTWKNEKKGKAMNLKVLYTDSLFESLFLIVVKVTDHKI